MATRKTNPKTKMKNCRRLTEARVLTPDQQLVQAIVGYALKGRAKRQAGEVGSRASRRGSFLKEPGRHRAHQAGNQKHWTIGRSRRQANAKMKSRI
jgi:hypothetical protein